jgi:hypothetical protein
MNWNAISIRYVCILSIIVCNVKVKRFHRASEYFTFWEIGAESNAYYVCIDGTKVRVYHQIKTLSRSLVRFRYLDERHADNGCRSTGIPQQSGRPEATPL